MKVKIKATGEIGTVYRIHFVLGIVEVCIKDKELTEDYKLEEVTILDFSEIEYEQNGKVNIKEADLKLVADMQHVIDVQNDAMSWAAQCLVYNDVLKHQQFDDVGDVDLLTGCVVSSIRNRKKTYDEGITKMAKDYIEENKMTLDPYGISAISDFAEEVKEFVISH